MSRLIASIPAHCSLENLYGPTEATIAFTVYAYRADAPRIAALPVVPIGMPLPGQEVVILEEHFLPVADGETGELYQGGAQLAQGGLLGKHRTDTPAFPEHALRGQAGESLVSNR